MRETNKLVVGLLVVASLGMMLAMVWLAAEARSQRVDAEMRANLRHEVVDVARNVNPVLAKKLTFTATDQGSMAFEYVGQQLTTAGKSFQQRGAYSLTLREKQIVFGPTTYPGGVPPIHAAAPALEQLTAAARQVFSEQRPLVGGPATDAGGAFYFAIAPVLDPGSGKVVLAVAIEVGAEEWQTRINSARQGPLLAMAILVLIVLGIVLAIRWHNRQRKEYLMQLKMWVMVPTGLTMLVGLLLFWTYQQQLVREKSREELRRITEQANNEWHRNIDSHVQLLQVQVEHLSRDPSLLSAWRGRDLAALKALGQPIFAGLKGVYQITHFYFIEPERTCFLRVHQPDRRGDLIDRDTLLAAMRTGEDAWGTELGPLGTFTLRYVRPWRQEGRVVGYLELGMEIEGLVDDLAQSLKLDLVTLIRKEFSTKAKFAAGQKAFGFVGTWDAYRDFVVTHQTGPELPAAAAAWVARGHAPFVPGVMARSKQGEREVLCSLLHLPDAGGRDVADLILMVDVTARAKAERNALFLNLGLAVMMFGCILVLLWSVTGTAEQQLQRAFTKMQESEESYRRQFADNSEVMLLIDPDDGRILDANAAAVDFYGHPRTRLLNMRITDINSRAASEVKLSMEADGYGKNRHFEFQHRLADGSIREVEIVSSLIHIGARRVLHTMIHDITAHKREVERLTEKIRQLEQQA